MQTMNKKLSENSNANVSNVKKLFAVIAVAIALVISGVFAYLTATDTKTNRFTISNSLDVTVVETAWDALPDSAKSNILPAQTVTKDPALKNESNSPIWAFLEIQVPVRNVVVANADGTKNAAAMTELFSFDANEADVLNNVTGWTLQDTIDYGDTMSYVYVYNDFLGAGETSGTVFDSVTLANLVDNQLSGAELLQRIIVNGYGVQASGFDDADAAYAAITLRNAIMSGSNTVYTGTQTMSFQSSAPLDTLIDVSVDGTVVAPDNYTATSGSTVITFKNTYMRTLDDGWHIISINNGDTYGTISTNFRVSFADHTHVYASEITTASTCTISGIRTFTCACGDTYTERLGVLEHNFSGGICSSCGLNETAAGYATAYAMAADGQKGTNVGFGVIWWMDNSNTIHIAPKNGVSGQIYRVWGNSSPFTSVNTVATSVTVEPGVQTYNKGSLDYLFQNCSALTSIEGLSNLDVSNAQTMQYVFGGCTSLTTLDGISNWNVSNTPYMAGLFSGCSNLADIDALSNWNVSSLTDTASMFYGCSSLTTLDSLSTWNVGNVTQMSQMFRGCSGLTSLDGITNWNTSKNKNFSQMFYKCTSLTSLAPIFSWNTGSGIYMHEIFYGIPSSVTRPYWGS